nr:AlNc14C531G12068 [Albugo laibachii Nc14]|eukprot:CCA27424.1 AlNc14C531G12068 [Albugo laibachii Nc14]
MYQASVSAGKTGIWTDGPNSKTANKLYCVALQLKKKRKKQSKNINDPHVHALVNAGTQSAEDPLVLIWSSGSATKLCGTKIYEYIVKKRQVQYCYTKYQRQIDTEPVLAQASRYTPSETVILDYYSDCVLAYHWKGKSCNAGLDAQIGEV